MNINGATAITNGHHFSKDSLQEFINAILFAFDEAGTYYVRFSDDAGSDEVAKYLRCVAYNEGVSAAEESVVAVLRKYGFNVLPRTDEGEGE